MTWMGHKYQTYINDVGAIGSKYYLAVDSDSKDLGKKDVVVEFHPVPIEAKAAKIKEKKQTNPTKEDMKNAVNYIPTWHTDKWDPVIQLNGKTYPNFASVPNNYAKSINCEWVFDEVKQEVNQVKACISPSSKFIFEENPYLPSSTYILPSNPECYATVDITNYLYFVVPAKDESRANEWVRWLNSRRELYSCVLLDRKSPTNSGLSILGWSFSSFDHSNNPAKSYVGPSVYQLVGYFDTIEDVMAIHIEQWTTDRQITFIPSRPDDGHQLLPVFSFLSEPNGWIAPLKTQNRYEIGRLAEALLIHIPQCSIPFSPEHLPFPVDMPQHSKPVPLFCDTLAERISGILKDD